MVNQSEIFILSGPVQSGKSSSLNKWLEGRQDVDGILAPIINGQRNLQHISRAEHKNVQLDKSEQGKYSFWAIGNHILSQEVFFWAQEILQECASKPLEWLIVDEVGFLELQGRGFEPVLSRILTSESSIKPARILLVVREYLVDKVEQHYNLGGRTQTFSFPE